MRKRLEKTLPVISNKAVWEKTTSQGAGKIRYNIVEDIFMHLEADQKKVPSMEKFASTRQKKEDRG